MSDVTSKKFIEFLELDRKGKEYSRQRMGIVHAKTASQLERQPMDDAARATAAVTCPVGTCDRMQLLGKNCFPYR